jgi:hypothetical protein
MKSTVFWDVNTVALVRTDVSEELSAYVPPNLGSYTSHTA